MQAGHGAEPAGRSAQTKDPLDIFLTHIHTDHMGLASELVRPGGTIYVGELDFPFTNQAWEDNYWREIDQRFLQEGFPQRSWPSPPPPTPPGPWGPTWTCPTTGR